MTAALSTSGLIWFVFISSFLCETCSPILHLWSTEPSRTQEYGLNFSFFPYFDPCGRSGRFDGVTDRSNRNFNDTGGPFWTDT